MIHLREQPASEEETKREQKKIIKEQKNRAAKFIIHAVDLFFRLLPSICMRQRIIDETITNWNSSGLTGSMNKELYADSIYVFDRVILRPLLRICPVSASTIFFFFLSYSPSSTSAIHHRPFFPPSESASATEFRRSDVIVPAISESSGLCGRNRKR